MSLRPDLQAIFEMIPAKMRVLDLGCGDASLLRKLKIEKDAAVCGVEKSQKMILECVSNGIPVVHCDLNKGLKDFSADSFDYVVLSQTLQAIKNPDELLGEMFRVGQKVLISMINFGHWSVWSHLLFKGRMPVNENLSAPWYKTSNIRMGTIKDFRELCASKGLEIAREMPIPSLERSFFRRFSSNIFAKNCVFLLTQSEELRPDLKTIFELVPRNAKVLDLGCGDGSLLSKLKKEKSAFVCGVEKSQEMIKKCVSSSVPVVHGDLNKGLSDFADKSFDYVILSQTLQTIKNPDELLEEMIRVGDNVLISLINFGHWSIWSQLFLNGRMPVSESLPSPWYSTSNIHLGTINDFRDLCRSRNISILDEIPVNSSGIPILAEQFPNFFAQNCVFKLRKI